MPPLVVDAQAEPDFSILDAVIADIGQGLQPGTVVSVETTIPVGTTRSRVSPALAQTSGLRAEEDFFCVHSPERVYSGRIFADLETYPKLVGGLTEAGEQRAAELYGAFIGAEVRRLGSAEAAELTKLAETTYRDVNIALANEFARFADRHGIDIGLVIEAANSQPFSHLHQPGVAVGGHCIPVYPRFYLSGDPAARLPAAARAVNDGDARLRGRHDRRRAAAGPRGRPRADPGGRPTAARSRRPRSRGHSRSRRNWWRAARRPLPPIRSTTPPSCARSASRPGRVSRSARPSCRPTTRSTPTLAPADVPGRPCWSTAAALSTPRPGGPPGSACAASADRSEPGPHGRAHRKMFVRADKHTHGLEVHDRGHDLLPR